LDGWALPGVAAYTVDFSTDQSLSHARGNISDVPLWCGKARGQFRRDVTAKILDAEKPGQGPGEAASNEAADPRDRRVVRDRTKLARPSVSDDHGTKAVCLPSSVARLQAPGGGREVPPRKRKKKGTNMIPRPTARTLDSKRWAHQRPWAAWPRVTPEKCSDESHLYRVPLLSPADTAAEADGCASGCSCPGTSRKHVTGGSHQQPAAPCGQRGRHGRRRDHRDRSKRWR
jgi:hypothetical protein